MAAIVCEVCPLNFFLLVLSKKTLYKEYMFTSEPCHPLAILLTTESP